MTYEEDAEGFQFSLLPSKKPRPSIEAVPENSRSDVENAPPKSTPKRGRPRKKQKDDENTPSAVPAKGKSVELPSRRPTRGAANTSHTEPESQPTNTIRSSRARDSPEHQPETKKPKKAGRPPKAKQQVQVSESNGYNSPAQPPEGTKVALPVADTPVIQRNKEFRGGKGDKSDKGRRRSSLSMRGRRASFLIDSGTSNGRFVGLRWAINGRMLIFLSFSRTALPHREVSTADFYKHIADDGIPEPRRMRQLLIWCATRAIGEKPSGGSNSDDQSARLAGTWHPLACVSGSVDLTFSSACDSRGDSSRFLEQLRAFELAQPRGFEPSSRGCQEAEPAKRTKYRQDQGIGGAYTEVSISLRADTSTVLTDSQITQRKAISQCASSTASDPSRQG